MITLAIAALALQQAASPADAKPDKQKKVCRKIEVMGSRLPNLECHTADEWKARDESSRMNGSDRTQLERMETQGQLRSPG